MQLWIVLQAPQSCFQQNRLLCISFIVLLSQTRFAWSLRLIKHFLFRFIFYLAAVGLRCSIQHLPDSLWHIRYLAGLDEAQVGIKIAGRNTNNLRYADEITLMAESEEELKNLLTKVKKES